MNNQLRKIKKSRLVEKDAFTYMICSDDKINASNDFYDIDFGGFELPYDNYKCEVLNCAHTGRVSTVPFFLYLIAENLANNGYFFRSRLQNRAAVVAVLPVVQIADTYVQSDGSIGTTFNVINCRIKRRLKFSFVKPDFSNVVNGTDINVGGDKRCFITLKMTPIVDY
jgi:hypothetical protein